jgi:hypothetical protein
MSSIPTQFYGTHPNDDHEPHQNFMAPIDASYNMGFRELFYPTHFYGVPAPPFPVPNNISATQSPYEDLPPSLTNGVTNDAGLPPVFPTYNAFPHFQTPFSAMTSSRFFSGLPTTPESTLAPSPGPSHGNLFKPKRKRDTHRKSKETNAKLVAAKRKRVAHTRRSQGPNRNTSRRPYGGFEDMLVCSPHPVLNNYERPLTERNSHRKKKIE